jgi:hypothetical protein
MGILWRIYKTMTTLQKIWIPNNIDSVEKLWVWSAEILQYRYPNVLYTDSLDQNGEDLKLRVIEANTFFLTAPEPSEYRYLSRSAIRISPDYKLGGRIWEYAIPFDSPTSPQSVPVEMRQAA